MTEISRLRSTPLAVLVVLGLLYFGVAAWFTVGFVVMAVRGYFTVWLLGFLLFWVFAARMFRTWCGLAASGFALDFRGLYAEGDRLNYIAPAIRSVPLAELADAQAVRLGRHTLLEFRLRRGSRWRIPGFLLRDSAEAAAERARQLIKG